MLRNHSGLRIWLSLAVVAVFCAISGASLWGQSVSKTPAAIRSDLERLYKSVQDSDANADTVKAEAKAILDLGISALTSATEIENKTKTFEILNSELPKKMTAITAEVNKPAFTFSDTDITTDMTALQWENALKKLQETYDAARRDLQKTDASISGAKERTAKIQARLAAIGTEVGTLHDEDSQLLTSDSMTQLKKKSLDARLNYLIKEEAQLKLESSQISGYSEYWPLLKLVQQRQVDLLSKKCDVYERRYERQKQNERKQGMKAELTNENRLVQTYPELKPVVAENEKYYNMLVGDDSPQNKLTFFSKDKVNITEMLRCVTDYRDLVQQRHNATGLDFDSSLRLIEQYKRLPATADVKLSWTTVKQSLSDSQYMLLTIREELFPLSDPLLAADRSYERLGIKETSGTKEELVPEIRKLLEMRRVVLENLNADYGALLSLLTDSDNTYKAFFANVSFLRRELSEELFWAKCSNQVSLSSLPKVFKGLQELYSLYNWKDLWGELVATRGPYSMYAFLYLLLILGLGYWIPITKKRIQNVVAPNVASQDISIFLTAKALGYSLIVPCLVYMLLIYFSVRLLDVAKEPTDFLASHLCTAFHYVAPLSWSLLLAYYISIPGGVGERHLGWPVETTKLLNRLSIKMFWIGLVFKLFFGTYLMASELQIASGVVNYDIRDPNIIELNRISFLAFILILAAFIWKIFHPKTGVLRLINEDAYVTEVRTSKLFVRRVIQVIPVGVALISFGLLAMGYELACLALYRGLIAFLHILFITSVINAVVVKSLQISQKRMLSIVLRRIQDKNAASQVVPRPTQAPGTDQTRTDNPETVGGLSFLTDEDRTNQFVYLRQLYERTTKMTSTLIWFCGIGILVTKCLACAPVLDRIGQIGLWTTEVNTSVNSVAGITPSTSSQPFLNVVKPALPISGSVATTSSTGTERKVVMISGAGVTFSDNIRVITVYDVFCSLLILIIALLGAKNLKDLLELILRQLPISESSRYGIRTIIGYIFAVGGIVLSLGKLGVSWTNVQWIIAAATVGLGFGMQEVFANLVSGLIILVERPIRVGDTVTINGVTGKVTNISMRCTIIRDFDLKDLIVPNKKIITDSVINASLSSHILRDSIEFVCDLKGASPEEITKLVTQTALETVGVLVDPKPLAVLASVEKCQKYILWYYVDTKQHSQTAVRSQLYVKLRKELRDYL